MKAYVCGSRMGHFDWGMVTFLSMFYLRIGWLPSRVINPKNTEVPTRRSTVYFHRTA
jgi:hypothetical protein